MSISVENRRRLIFFTALIAYFFTCMNKVLVPGSLYTEIRDGLLLNANELALLGSGFMISYGLSNFLLGIFSDRYGGSRLLMIGTTLFALGAVAAVFSGNFTYFFLARLVVGFGAGVCYIGISKLTTELFERGFLWMLTLVLMTGCAGVLAGGTPMLALAQHSSWRVAIAVPAAVGVAAALLIATSARGALLPVRSGNQWGALKEFFGAWRNLQIIASSGTIIGGYFALMSLIGKKCLDDDGAFSAATIGVIFSAFIATNMLINPVANLILKWTGNHRKRFMVALTLVSITGSTLCALRYSVSAPAYLVVIGLIMIASAGGCSAIYFSIIKDFNPPRITGLAISMLNCTAFVFIAVEQQMVGFIIHAFEKSAVGGVYPPEAYAAVFAALGAMSFVGMLFALRMPEPVKSTQSN